MKKVLVTGVLLVAVGAALRFLPEGEGAAERTSTTAPTVAHSPLVDARNGGSTSAFDGFLKIWSSSSSPDPASQAPATPAPQEPRKATQPTPEQILAQARFHAKVSARILQLQAERDPANAKVYLAQADQISARSEPVLPPTVKPPTEYQQKLNAAISTRISEIAGKPSSPSYASSTADRNTSTALRAGDAVGPRPGDIATR